MKGIPQDILEVGGQLWWELSTIATGQILKGLMGTPPGSYYSERILERACASGFVKKNEVGEGKWAWVLTDKFERYIIGQRHPVAGWSRSWDGHWQLLSFDLPASRRDLRYKLHKLLRYNGFGILQNSLWVTPCMPERLQDELQLINVAAKEMALFEAAFRGSDSSLVSMAWPWARIEAKYTEYMGRFEQYLTFFQERAWSWPQLVSAESKLWVEASSLDPFLPESLCPPGYLGQQAWNQRLKLMRQNIPKR